MNETNKESVVDLDLPLLLESIKRVEESLGPATVSLNRTRLRAVISTLNNFIQADCEDPQ